MPLTRDQATDAAALDASLDAALAACHPTFAYHPWQRRALKSIMSVPSRDTFVVAPTSAGKSLVMEMAARLLKKPVLIVLPLNALQSDMAASFRSSGLRVLCGATDDVTKVRFALAERFANCDVVMVSAETVTSPSWKKAIAAAGSNLGVIFVDEAHCMNHWGVPADDKAAVAFRPAYAGLRMFRVHAENVPLCAVTATLFEKDRQQAVSLLKLKDVQWIEEPFSRDNLFFKAVQVDPGQKAILGFIRSSEMQSLLKSMQQPVSEWTPLLLPRFFSGNYRPGDGPRAFPQRAGGTTLATRRE